MKNYANRSLKPTTTGCKVCQRTFSLGASGLYAHMTAHNIASPLEQYKLPVRLNRK
jgi:hypothetical protein